MRSLFNICSYKYAIFDSPKVTHNKQAKKRILESFFQSCNLCQKIAFLITSNDPLQRLPTNQRQEFYSKVGSDGLTKRGPGARKVTGAII